MSERRQEERLLFNQKAWVQLGTELVECTIVEISQCGARIDIGKPLPHIFPLLFSRNGNVKRQCQLIWQDSSRAGLNFLS